MTLAEYKQSIAQSAKSKPRRRTRIAAENQIRKTISAYLTALGIPHTITEAAAARAQSGAYISGRVDPSWPDITGVIPRGVSPALEGRLLAIEIKTEDGKLNPARMVKRGFHWVAIPSQEDVLESLRRAGAVALVARSIEDLKEGLRAAEDAVRRGMGMDEGLPELE